MVALLQLHMLSQNGGQCMVLPTVSQEDAAKLFPEHKVASVPSGKSYIRVTPQPWTQPASTNKASIV